ncbi:hypothetical protein [Mesorhizobium sp.]|uniref:hypothetical protein n=1 Tax=Mesorhizobium sp. TaxID=1871066 RepID=UPI0025D30920|nr:hypothetical protein [Mesorhizobium sp.]
MSDALIAELRKVAGTVWDQGPISLAAIPASTGAISAPPPWVRPPTPPKWWRW